MQSVVFDANVYRALCHGVKSTEAIELGRLLASAESKAGIVAVGAQAVALELAFHLSKPDSPCYEVCLSALCMMTMHCNKHPDGRGHVRFMHMADDLLSKALYSVHTAEALEFAMILDKILANIAFDPRAEGLVKLQEHLNALSIFVSNVEQSFVNLLGRFHHKFLNSPVGNNAFYKRLLATEYGQKEATEYLVKRSRLAAGINGAETRMAELSGIVWAKFPTAVEFAIQRIDRVIDGAELERDGNSAWDWELSFLVGQTISATDDHANLPLCLITDDNALHRAASASGQSTSVLRMRDYLSRIDWKSR